MLHGSAEKPLILTSQSGTQYTLLPAITLQPGEEGPTALLGKGQFGTVSIAFTETLEPVAVKLLELDKTDPNFPALMQEIEKETAIMKHLGRQADIVEMPHPTEANKVMLYVIQPFLPGKELKKHFEELLKESRKLGPENVVGQLEILNELVLSFIAAFRATKELHDADVIHGDLHQGNILYDPLTHTAKAIDFGMSYLLAPGQDQVYVAEESPMANMHRAPETRELKVRREGYGPERVYDKSVDCYALAIDCGIDTELGDNFAPDPAAREIARLLVLFKELSQEPMIGGNGNPADRLAIEEAITRLVDIQFRIQMRVNQQQIFKIPSAEIQQIAERFHANTSERKREMLQEAGLPEFALENYRMMVAEKKKLDALLAKNPSTPSSYREAYQKMITPLTMLYGARTRANSDTAKTQQPAEEKTDKRGFKPQT